MTISQMDTLMYDLRQAILRERSVLTSVIRNLLLSVELDPECVDLVNVTKQTIAVARVALRTYHPWQVNGKCPVCGHYGDSCYGERP